MILKLMNGKGIKGREISSSFFYYVYVNPLKGLCVKSSVSTRIQAVHG